jgi:hypothetical protein
MPGLCGKGICHLPSSRHPLLGIVCKSNVAVEFESRKLTYQRVSSTSARGRCVWKFICSDNSQTLIVALRNR